MNLSKQIVLYLFAAYVLSLVFTLTEFYGIANNQVCWFVFPDLDEDIDSPTYGMYIERCVRMDSYVYYFFHHIISIMFYYLPIFIHHRKPILNDAKAIVSIKAMICLEIMDFVDYLVIYNDTWFNYRGFNMNYNHLHSSLFLVILLFNKPWNHLKGLYR